MKNLTTFQLALIALFLGFILIGTLIFAGILPGYRSPSGGQAGELTIWGTVPASNVQDIIENFNRSYKDYFSLRYVEKAGASLERDFVEAKADNRAPDLLLLPHELGLTQRSRLAAIPTTMLSLRDYRDTYVDAGELWVGANGVSALPLVVDPIVLYYNRDLLNTAGLPTVPETWSQFVARTIALTKFDSRRNILQSAVAFGETRNIAHAKDLISLLLLQAGNPIVAVQSNRLVSTLNQDFKFTVKPAVAVTDFYTQFSDPARPNYSWNHSLPEARTAFSRGQTIFYFGYASEYSTIARENPHLVFDVALPPQSGELGRPSLTLGRLLSVAAVAGGSKVNAAAAAALGLAAAAPTADWSKLLYLPPARRDLLGQKVEDPVMALFYRAAILARTWFDPDPVGTKKILEAMVESVVTGRSQSSESVATADKDLNNLIGRIYGTP
ncbi:MAG: extracellular solute-binding protein [Patescibacteria group bacterium]